jgi:hypothetical protein
VAGGAGTGFLAGMLDLDTVFQQGITNSNAGLGINHDTFRAKFFMGQYDQLGHIYQFPVISCQLSVQKMRRSRTIPLITES